MKHHLAAVVIAALALGSAHAADPAAPADKGAQGQAEKSVDKAAKKPEAKKGEGGKAATGVDPVPSRQVPATAPTPMTGSRSLPREQPKADAKADAGLDAPSARTRPATGTTPMTGTRGIAKPAAPADKPAEAAKPGGDAAPAPPKQ
jgi:hypothetical protein